VDGRAGETKNDAHSQACHRDDCVGRGRGFRGRWLSYRSLEQALLPRVLDRLETNSRLVATNLEPMSAARLATLQPFGGWRRSPD
jgi:hypothetical protein